MCTVLRPRCWLVGFVVVRRSPVCWSVKPVYQLHIWFMHTVLWGKALSHVVPFGRLSVRRMVPRFVWFSSYSQSNIEGSRKGIYGEQDSWKRESCLYHHHLRFVVLFCRSWFWSFVFACRIQSFVSNPSVVFSRVTVSPLELSEERRVVLLLWSIVRSVLFVALVEE